MGDSAWTGVRLYEVPTGCVRGVVGVLSQFFDLTGDTELHLGATPYDDERDMGTWEELFTALRNEVPSATFEVWQSSNRESDGNVKVWVPGLGEWSADLGEEGDRIIAVHKLAKVSDMAELDRLIGGPWTRAIAAIGTEHIPLSMMIPAEPEDGDPDSHLDGCASCVTVRARHEGLARVRAEYDDSARLAPPPQPLECERAANPLVDASR